MTTIGNLLAYAIVMLMITVVVQDFRKSQSANRPDAKGKATGKNAASAALVLIMFWAVWWIDS